MQKRAAEPRTSSSCSKINTGTTTATDTAAMSELVHSRTTVFYAIFEDDILKKLKDPEIVTRNEYEQVASSLFSLHVKILDIITPYVTDFIWRHEPFTLYPSTTVPPNPNFDNIPCLHGNTRFGSHYDDEWFIVFLLTEISKKIPNVSIRVWDSYGEFLLLGYIPLKLYKMGKNRVFIRGGEVILVHKDSMPMKSTLIANLSFLTFYEIEEPAPYSVKLTVERKISDHPEKLKLNVHQIRVRVPISVAKLLTHEPCLISLAIEGFCNRNDADLRKLSEKMDTFLKTSEVTDEGVKKEELVRISVRMSRPMYAPKCYPIPPETVSLVYVETVLGMKLAYGFELMYQKSIREGKGGKGITTLEAFKRCLKKKGYFKGLPSQSAKYRLLEQKAQGYYTKSSLFSREREVINAPVSRVDEILLLPHSVKEFKGLNLLPSDDDAWLYQEERRLKLVISRREEDTERLESQSTEEGSSSESDSDNRYIPYGFDSDFSYDDFTDPFNDLYNEYSDDEILMLELMGVDLSKDGGKRRRPRKNI
ncbi:hypothetical protein MKW98_010104 [Papaver atlanticum]|uniref:Uncharacterized protein n=1 Tax=Papaver atlanticum TaxID=357466 RepID=A0AAD4RYR2_9MAGN|nr:hypothetical protein MKW98_010104 [Papaver atlanticum]